MNKRYALIMVTMMLLAVLLSACSSDSKDAGKDYMEAVIKGDQEKAEALACDSFGGTAELIAFFQDEVKAVGNSVELQVDMGKTNNQEELRVTGSVDCERSATAENCGSKNEYVFSEKKGTLIILEMVEDDGDWCVSEESHFEGTPLDMTMAEDGEAEDAETEDADAEDAEMDDAATDDAETDDAATDDAETDDAGSDEAGDDSDSD